MIISMSFIALRIVSYGPLKNCLEYGIVMIEPRIWERDRCMHTTRIGV